MKLKKEDKNCLIPVGKSLIDYCEDRDKNLPEASFGTPMPKVKQPRIPDDDDQWIYDYTFGPENVFRVDRRVCELSKYIQEKNGRELTKMKLGNSGSYTAIITKIKTKPHPNADRIQLGICQNSQVIIGLDVKDGDLGIFFSPDGQLSSEYATANDLVGYIGDDGEKKGGYFGLKRRVSAQAFRGEKSDGYWAPLSSLAFTGINLAGLREGDVFDSLDEIPICNKYITPATIKAMKVKGSKCKVSQKYIDFPKHMDTGQLKYNINQIQAPCTIYVGEQLHGTSGRTGKLLEAIPYTKSIKETIGDFIGGKGWNRGAIRKEWRLVNGSRNVILKDSNEEGFYGNEEFRVNVLPLNLEANMIKGEIIFYEIVGYTTTNKPIMKTVSTKTIKDKNFHKDYGDEMTFSYGCKEGQCELYVYRIAYITEDGHLIDLSWPRVEARAKSLGLKVVDVSNTFEYTMRDPDELFKSIDTELKREECSKFDSSHIKEGVVARIENKDGVYFLKHKSHRFYVLEGILKEDESYVDIEESS